MTENASHEGERENRERDRDAPARVLIVGDWLVPYLGDIKDEVAHDIEIRTIEEDEGQLRANVGWADVLVSTFLSTAAAEAAHRLSFLQVPGSGLDKICLSDLSQKVSVANCYEHERAIAEYVIMQCLALASRLLELDKSLRQGDWRLSPIGGAAPRAEVAGQTLGIVGFGRIGREVAKLAKALDMRTIVATRTVPPKEDWYELSADFVGETSYLGTLLRRSDFVVLAVPLSESTRAMIGEVELAAMKETAFLINPSRGPVVEEYALFSAVQNRTIAGVAIDTWYQYPDDSSGTKFPSTYPFHSLPNVILTPHIAGYSAPTVSRRIAIVGKNIDAHLRGDSLLCEVKR